MSARTFTWCMIVVIPAVVVAAGLAIRYAINEGARNRAACEAIHTRPVSTGHNRFLCISEDGRVVAP